MSEPFVGEIRIFGFTFAPRNWAFCDGSLLLISQNSALFSIIGTTYGGNGRTDFALPNLQGRAPMHAGNGPGLTPRTLGQTGGAETATLTANQMPSHNHAFVGDSALGNETIPSSNRLAQSPSGRGGFGLYANADNTGAMADGILLAQGGNVAHNNLQPYLAINFCIALLGLFPNRS